MDIGLFSVGWLAGGARGVRRCGYGRAVNRLGFISRQLQLAVCALAVLSQRFGLSRACSAQRPHLYLRLCVNDDTWKAGELLRGIFLKTRGMPYKQSTAAFLSERLSDLVAVVLLAMLGVRSIRKEASPC